MSAYADEHGCQGIAVSEHHASDDGYLPSPLTMAAAVAAVTSSTPILVAAALLPLYDPVRMAEEMIVLDHLSRGRVIHILGIGYRPVEYELHGEDFHRRGRSRRREAGGAARAAAGGGRGRAPAGSPRRRSPPADRCSCGAGPPPRRRRAPGATGSASSPSPATPPSARPTRRPPARPATSRACACCPTPDSPASVFVADDVDAGLAGGR